MMRTSFCVKKYSIRDVIILKGGQIIIFYPDKYLCLKKECSNFIEETWVGCDVCKTWLHCACAKVPLHIAQQKDFQFVCEYCTCILFIMIHTLFFVLLVQVSTLQTLFLVQ